MDGSPERRSGPLGDPSGMRSAPAEAPGPARAASGSDASPWRVRRPAAPPVARPMPAAAARCWARPCAPAQQARVLGWERSRYARGYEHAASAGRSMHRCCQLRVENRLAILDIGDGRHTRGGRSTMEPSVGSTDCIDPVAGKLTARSHCRRAAHVPHRTPLRRRPSTRAGTVCGASGTECAAAPSGH